MLVVPRERVHRQRERAARVGTGTAAQQLASLGPDLYTTIQTRNTAATQAFAEMQKAVRLLKVDMTSAMSVTVTYVDNDGD